MPRKHQKLAEAFEILYDEDGGDWSDEELDRRIKEFLSRMAVPPEQQAEVAEAIYTHLGDLNDW